MSRPAKAREQERKAWARLRVLRHHEQVTRNVSQTCRFLGIRTLFTSPAHIVPLILQVRRPRQYGPLRLSLFPQRYHQVYVSAPTIQRILKWHRISLVSLKRYRPGLCRRRREIHVPRQSVQVDVKHLKPGGRPFYQFTAIDEATRYRALRGHAHNSIKSATEFVEEVRRRLPMAIQRIQNGPWLRVWDRLHLASAGSRGHPPADSAQLSPGQWKA